MKKMYKIILIIIALVICGAVWAVTSTQSTGVETLTLKKGDLADTFTVQGNAAPKEYLMLNAPYSGTVKNVFTEEGRLLSSGEPILEIDAADARRQIALQKSQLEQQLKEARHNYDRLFGSGGVAKAQLAGALLVYEQARQDYDNGMALHEQGGLSQRDLAVLEQSLALAEQNFILAQADSSEAAQSHYQAVIRSIETQITLTEKAASSAIPDQQQNIIRINAPFEAVVWEITAVTGVFVMENQPLAKIYQGRDMKITASLLAADALRVKPGDSVSCRLGSGVEFPGTISFISPVAQESLSSIGLTENRCLVEIETADLPPQAGAGYPVDITFSITAATDTLAVPLSALVVQQTQDAVYLLRGGKAELTIVETGVRSGGSVQILSGLTAGDQIVVDPYDDGIKQGSRIHSL